MITRSVYQGGTASGVGSAAQATPQRPEDAAWQMELILYY